MPTNPQDLRSKIKGWGADLEPSRRPGVPREKRPPRDTGAHWREPERQVPRGEILRSIEHKELTPVFGTACPLKGLSGVIRRYAYTLSEGRKLHWVLLLIADRVDVVESALDSLYFRRAHNPLSEMGLGSELHHHAYRSRFGQHRTDVRRWRREAVFVTSLTAFFLLRKALGKRAEKRGSDLAA